MKKKLFLKKETIASLSNSEQKLVLGGKMANSVEDCTQCGNGCRGEGGGTNSCNCGSGGLWPYPGSNFRTCYC